MVDHPGEGQEEDHKDFLPLLDRKAIEFALNLDPPPSKDPELITSVTLLHPWLSRNYSVAQILLVGMWKCQSTFTAYYLQRLNPQEHGDLIHQSSGGRTTNGRRSNLRLAFPSQGKPNNESPSNNLDFPASGYPTTQMHTTPSTQLPPPPPLPPPRSSSTNASKGPAALSYTSSSPRNLMVPTVMVSRPKSHDSNLRSADQHPSVNLTEGSPNLSNSNCSGIRTICPARHQSLSPARSPQNLSPARPRNLSIGGLQNSSGEIQNFHYGVSQNQPTGNHSNMREQKKKHLILHLPPPHNHPPHHHHNQHHRHGIHHDGLRERGHKRTDKKISIMAHLALT
ncbi:uncharacterized protein [Palaemon carinicauda]|uniref:uncharacterized protein n=1 Tax=Palaemon carinicauda TaxID=392227 RepID=UPI0035B69A5A